MITVSVTSDSSVPELRVAERTIADLIKLAIGKDMEKPTLSEIAEYFKVPPASDVQKAINEAVEELYVNGTSTLEPRGIFNATELAEAEELGKPVCSTVDAAASQTAHVDTQANISLPEPTNVFGQAAQTTANVANPAVQTTGNLVLDADGLPWDARIHSSSKEPVKDGTWRKRRGVSDELVKRVEAELRQPELVKKALANVPSTLQPVTMIDVTTIDKPPQTEFQPTIPLPPPPVITETSPHHDVQVTISSGNMTFPELLDGVTKAMVAGQLTQARINEALNSIGVQALPHLIARTDMIPAFREALGGVV